MDAFKSELDEASDVFGGEQGKKRLEHLKVRVVQHDIQIISEYYSRITISRLADLVNLSNDEAEQRLSEMVVAKVG